MRLLKPFGDGGITRDWGYGLPLLVGHLEGLARAEEDNVGATSGAKAKRLEKVEEAIGLLNEAMDMGMEDHE